MRGEGHLVPEVSLRGVAIVYAPPCLSLARWRADLVLMRAYRLIVMSQSHIYGDEATSTATSALATSTATSALATSTATPAIPASTATSALHASTATATSTLHA